MPAPDGGVPPSGYASPPVLSSTFSRKVQQHPSGSNRHVRFVVSPDRIHDHAHPTLALLPADDLHALAFEILVAMKEVLHFLEHVRRRVGDVEPLLVIRIMQRHGENLVVRLSAI